MKANNIGGYRSVNAFIKAKLKKISSMQCNFETLYLMMFSERDNIIYERSRGYRLEKTTYGESFDRIEHKAEALCLLFPQLEYGDVIGIHMDNSLEWIETFWSVLRAGFNPLLMNTRLSAKTLEVAIEALDVKAVISDSTDFSVPTLRAENFTPSDSPIKNSRYGTELYVMSSGTSNKIKLCAYTADEILCQINDSFDILTKNKRLKKRYEGELKLLTFLPFYHIFGLVAVYIWFAFFSRTFVHLGDLSPQTIINTIRRHKVTHIFAVPMFWNKVYEQALITIRQRGTKTYNAFCKALLIKTRLDRIPFLSRLFSHFAFREIRDNMFGESICFMISGGSEIKPQVISFFNSIGYHLANGYGMSEIGITSVELSNNPMILNTSSVGLPLPSVEYKLNEKGELLVKGNSVAKYVITGDDKKYNDDWFNTHDIAEIRNGRYYILGRRDDLIISPSGENLNPNIIEPLLDDIAGVSELCLTSIEAGGKTSPVLIVSVQKYISDTKLSALKQKMNERLMQCNLEGQISRIVYTSSPLIIGNEIKINRRRISSEYRSGKLKPIEFNRSSDNDGNDNIFKEVAGAFAQALEITEKEIYPDFDFFADGGGTSLDYFAAVCELTREFGIELPAENERSLCTARDICKYIEEQISR